MKLCGLQLDIAWENKAANYERVVEILDKSDEAALPPGSLLVLPEMFATGFSMAVARQAENEPAPTAMFLASLAAKYGIYVIGGLSVQGEAGKGRNEARVFAPSGAQAARYCKLHPFSYSGEHEAYSAGNELAFFEWNGFNVSPFICYDLRFPEIFRAATQQEANLLVVIANWPQVREAHWLTLLQARAIENQAYVIGVNRCGSDPHLKYGGRSLIIGPRGDIQVDAGTDEGLFGIECDIEDLQNYRREFPVLQDRRSEW